MSAYMSHDLSRDCMAEVDVTSSEQASTCCCRCRRCLWLSSHFTYANPLTFTLIS